MKENQTDRFKGKRCLNWIRCSDDHQIESSIADQLKLLNTFAAEHGLVHVGDVILEGVTGSIPNARDDIEMIIRRKLEQDDFDVVLLQDVSRLTRFGAEHGSAIEYRLMEVGIEIVYVAENLPQGDHAGIVKSFALYAAKQHAKSIGFGAARGQMSALLAGKMPYCSVPPYGVDRLVISSTGEARFVLRNLHDGSQHKLALDGKTILQVFPRSQTRGKSSHYRRQADERIEFIRGSDESVAAVRNIYRWHFVNGWGYGRIAAELNRTGIKPMKGARWNTAAVANILWNSIYLGRSIANRYSKAIFNMRSPNMPKAALVEQRELVRKGASLKLRVRPQEDWITIDHERLADYLDADIRPLAAEKQAKFWLEKAKNRTPKFSRDAHGDSPYILKHILKQKGTGLPLTGRKGGPKHKRQRFYAVGRAFSTPCGELSKKMIPAPQLERAVLDQVKGVLAGAPDLKNVVRELVIQQTKGNVTDVDKLTELENEKAGLTEKLDFVIENLQAIGKAAAANKVAEIDRKLAEISRRIETAKAVGKTKPMDIDEQSAAIVRRLQDLADGLDKLSAKVLRGLLESVIDRLEIDLHTRAVELDLRLPPWALEITKNGTTESCLDAKPLWPSGKQATFSFTLKIAEIDCVGHRKPNGFDCCRRRKAA